jgi:hypothetical protein
LIYRLANYDTQGFWPPLFILQVIENTSRALRRWEHNNKEAKTQSLRSITSATGVGFSMQSCSLWRGEYVKT